MRHARRVGSVLAVVLVSMRAGAEPGQSAPPRFVTMLGRVAPFYLVPLETAVREARRKLSVSPCQAVFEDFRDAVGVLAAERYGSTGVGPSEYLQAIQFQDGRSSVQCAPADAYAWTHPGSPVIHVCLDRFARLSRLSVSTAADLIIHEELHALGLGENPPDSRRITDQVRRRCGA
jgi:hypothetical protein